MPARSLAVVLLAVAAYGAACAPKPTRVSAEPPPLAVPVVPPRVLAQSPAEPEPPAPEPEPVLPVAHSPRRQVRPRVDAQKQVAVPADAAKQEGATSEPPADASKPASTPAAAEPVLRTQQTKDDAEAEKRVKDAIARATQALDRVNVARLGPDGRTQYETARRFVDQADGALRARNYTFAGYLADKAEALARGLVGR